MHVCVFNVYARFYVFIPTSLNVRVMYLSMYLCVYASTVYQSECAFNVSHSVFVCMYSKSPVVHVSFLADEVRMWVYEEVLPSGEKLTEVINTRKVCILGFELYMYAL